VSIQDLKIDETVRDLAIEGGDIALIAGNEAVPQRSTIALRLHRGEWFMDLSAGVPWSEWFRMKPFKPQAAEIFLKRYLRGLLGVASIEEIDLTLGDDRSMEVEYRYTLADGEGGVDSTLITG